MTNTRTQRVEVKVDNHGQPFENQAEQDLYERREKDPVFSLERSKEDYAMAIKDLFDHVGNHDADTKCIEFVEVLREKTEAVEQALRQVQFDIERVASVKNSGWYEIPTGYRASRIPYSRFVRSASYNGRPRAFPAHLIGDERPLKWDDDDDLPEPAISSEY